jgi:hypothetical protein
MGKRRFYFYLSYVLFSIAMTIFCIKVVHDLIQVQVIYDPIRIKIDQPWWNYYFFQEGAQQVAILVITSIIAALVSTNRNYKARLVWIGIIANITYVNCLLAIHNHSLLFLVIMLLFIISMVTSFLSMERSRICFAIERQDNRLILWGLIGYVCTTALALAIEAFTRLPNVQPIFFYPFRPEFHSSYLDYSWALSIIIISFFLLTFFLILRRVVWGYAAAVVLLLANYDGIVSVLTEYERYFLEYIVPINPSDFFSLSTISHLRNAYALYTLFSLAYVSSFVAVFLAYLIVKRMREEPIRKD